MEEELADVGGQACGDFGRDGCGEEPCLVVAWIG